MAVIGDFFQLPREMSLEKSTQEGNWGLSGIPLSLHLPHKERSPLTFLLGSTDYLNAKMITFSNTKPEDISLYTGCRWLNLCY